MIWEQPQSEGEEYADTDINRADHSNTDRDHSDQGSGYNLSRRERNTLILTETVLTTVILAETIVTNDLGTTSVGGRGIR